MAEVRKSVHDACLREFKRLIQDCTSQAVCGRSYVRVARLKTWLRGRNEPHHHMTQIACLLHTAYRNDPIGWSVESDRCASEESCCLLVFSILLLLNKSNLIHVFQRNNIMDYHLPKPLRELEFALQGAGVDNPRELAVAFNEKQWSFCPVNFDLHLSREYRQEEIILPICRKEVINVKGGTAQLYQIDVREDFIGPRLRKAAARSRYNYAVGDQPPDWVSIINSAHTTLYHSLQAVHLH